MTSKLSTSILNTSMDPKKLKTLMKNEIMRQLLKFLTLNWETFTQNLMIDDEDTDMETEEMGDTNENLQDYPVIEIISPENISRLKLMLGDLKDFELATIKNLIRSGCSDTLIHNYLLEVGPKQVDIHLLKKYFESYSLSNLITAFGKHQINLKTYLINLNLFLRKESREVQNYFENMVSLLGLLYPNGRKIIARFLSEHYLNYPDAYTATMTGINLFRQFCIFNKVSTAIITPQGKPESSYVSLIKPDGIYFKEKIKITIQGGKVISHEGLSADFAKTIQEFNPVHPVINRVLLNRDFEKIMKDTDWNTWKKKLQTADRIEIKKILETIMGKYAPCINSWKMLKDNSNR